MRFVIFYKFVIFYLFVNVSGLNEFICYDCDPLIFNKSITADDIPSIDPDRCRQTESSTGCFARIIWEDQFRSIVQYGTNLGSPLDTVEVHIKRQLLLSMGTYSTIKTIVYNCGGGTLNTTLCNNADALKHNIRSTTFPSQQQYERYDQLILSASTIEGSPCFVGSNLTDCSAGSDFSNCSQCIGVMQYSTTLLNICGTCALDSAYWNMVDYETYFYLNNQTRADVINIRCQSDRCNSIANMQQIRQTLVNKFDFNSDSNLAVLTMTWNHMLLLICVLIEVFLS